MSAGRKALIVNADDFGMSNSVNNGVLDAFRNGIVTQASIMANGPHFDEAVQMAGKWSLPLGVHINLTEGEPLSNIRSVGSLVNLNGRFLGKTLFIARTVLGLTKPDQVGLELSAQIERCIKAGVEPIRLDSHHHVHLLPYLQHIFRQVMEKYGILRMRCMSWPGPGVADPRAWWQQFLARVVAGSSRSNPQGQAVAHFYGFEFYISKNKKRTLSALLKALPDGVSELMCHPGYVEIGIDGRYRHRRQKEMEALCSRETRQFIVNHRIQLLDSTLRRKEILRINGATVGK